MVKESDVVQFLNDLKQKIKTFGIIIVDREKNRDTLSELVIYQSHIKNYISDLKAENFCKGPVKDSEHGGSYWEFGIEINNREIYIKINHGKFNKPVICISFHFAELKLKFRFKK
ncbi:MAG TPA: toxin [Ignavibacteria bacterium]|nr:toxin [Bacteroidota bacterium]HRI86346.1 toxin [Ignavibacteria bacterium]HRK00719.1 toxin [Ignavibacteria bacterium]